jgi:hypothetical protein
LELYKTEISDEINKLLGFDDILRTATERGVG